MQPFLQFSNDSRILKNDNKSRNFNSFANLSHYILKAQFDSQYDLPEYDTTSVTVNIL